MEENFNLMVTDNAEIIKAKLDDIRKKLISLIKETDYKELQLQAKKSCIEKSNKHTAYKRNVSLRI